VADHELEIEVSRGQHSSTYTGFCSCGWVSGDGRNEDQVRAEWAEHAAGRVPAWQMKPGERPGWERPAA
jgi:hypothetical protein